MRARVVCRECRQGNCPECIRHVYDGAGCEHACQDERQLGLFPANLVGPYARLRRPAAGDTSGDPT
jgi:hypothetical protein